MALCLWFEIFVSLASGYRRGEQALLHGNGTKHTQVLDSLRIDAKSRAHNSTSVDGLRHRHSSRDRGKSLEHVKGNDDKHLNAESTRVAAATENRSATSTSIGGDKLTACAVLLMAAFAVILCMCVFVAVVK